MTGARKTCWSLGLCAAMFAACAMPDESAAAGAQGMSANARSLERTSTRDPAIELRSHRAAYRLELDDVKRSSPMVGVQGGLVMEWRASCEGWLSNQRLAFVAERPEAPPFLYDVRFSSWESLDHDKLRFVVRSFDDGRLFETWQGQASLDPPVEDGLRGGVARFVAPADESLTLPAGTIFPTAHMQRLLEAARRGDRMLVQKVFDGSGPDALTLVTAVIGEARDGKDAAGGEPQRQWPVSLAYFRLDDAAAEGVVDRSARDMLDAGPDFEISFTLGSGGVLQDVVLDYGDFAMRGVLEDIEVFTPPTCE